MNSFSFKFLLHFIIAARKRKKKNPTNRPTNQQTNKNPKNKTKTSTQREQTLKVNPVQEACEVTVEDLKTESFWSQKKRKRTKTLR